MFFRKKNQIYNSNSTRTLFVSAYYSQSVRVAERPATNVSNRIRVAERPATNVPNCVRVAECPATSVSNPLDYKHKSII